MIASFFTFIVSGGIFMVPLIICSLATVTIIFLLYFRLRENRIIPPELEENLTWIAKNPHTIENSQSSAKLLKGCSQNQSLLGDILLFLFSRSFSSREEVSETLESRARETFIKLESVVSWLEVIITISPLLGLLGTASGLVNVFGSLGNTGDFDAQGPANIAKGIAEALSTTIIGLAITVPAVIANGYFSRKIEKLAARMETLIAPTLDVMIFYDQNDSSDKA